MGDRGSATTSSAHGEPERRDRAARRLLLVSLGGSVLIHLGVAVANPGLRISGAPPATGEDLLVLSALPERPPAVAVPRSARPIPPPARPVLATPSESGIREPPPPHIPHDVPPRLMNAADVASYLQAFYPPGLRLAGVEGSVVLWLYVDRSGEVTKLRISHSSGTKAFDELAQSAARLMRFRPALSRNRTVAVWVAQPVQFRLAAPDSLLAGGGR